MKPAASKAVEALASQTSKLSKILTDGFSDEQRQSEARPESVSNYPELRTMLLDAVKLIESGTLKIAIGLHSMEDDEAATSLCSAFLKPFEQFTSVGFLVLQLNLCTSLRKDVEVLCSQVCSACVAFVDVMASENVEEATVKVGVIGEIKDKMNTLPTCNTAALKRRVMQIVPVLKDTMGEFKEMLQEHESGDANPAAAPSDAGDVGDDWYDYFGDEDLTDEEAETVRLVVDQLALGLQVVKAVVGAANKAVQSESQAFVNWLNNVDQGSASFVSNVNLLCAELYPSHDEEALLEYFATFANCGVELLDRAVLCPEFKEGAGLVEQVAVLKSKWEAGVSAVNKHLEA